MNTHCRKESGFTLIELLVVIAIIGVLASVVLASLEDARLSAQYTVAKQELKLFEQSLFITKDTSSSLGAITGSYCSACSCGPLDLRNIPDGHPCLERWKSSLESIVAQTTLIEDTTSLLRDPWGSPYVLDENELERPADLCTYKDHIRTVGADGLKFTADDYTIFLPFRTGQCSGS